MKRESSGPVLSAVFVDYDNIYLSLKRKSEEAAKRFAKDAGSWLREIESGRLITPTNGVFGEIRRRMVMNRCYGNPVPRRNTHDNSTDMNSFPFVRHHFLRAGFEIIDCPPLTAQLKNSSDIRMVMDVRDFLTYDTYFDEFIILSGDADFTPVLHRLRAHARRTVIFANDYTAVPYTAICDGEVRESDLIRLLLDGQLTAETDAEQKGAAEMETIRGEIIAEVTTQLRSANRPLPLEVLAERATRVLGHERTVGSGWAGSGSFRDLLMAHLPPGLQITDDPPYLAYISDRRGTAVAPSAERTPQRLAPPARSEASPSASRRATPGSEAAEPSPAPLASDLAATGERAATAAPTTAASTAVARSSQPATSQWSRSPLLETQPASGTAEPSATAGGRSSASPSSPSGPARSTSPRVNLQQSIARIHEACQAPPLSPPEYRTLFESLAAEINEQGPHGEQTIANVQARARDNGTSLQRDDIRFVFDVVSEPDPWLEQGASANLFAGRFRNFVVGRCRSQGLSLSSDELDLIEAWFTGGPPPSAPSRYSRPSTGGGEGPGARHAAAQPAAEPRSDSWWATESQRGSSEQRGAEPRPAAARGALMGAASEPPALAQFAGGEPDDEFPRIVRTRVRG